MPTLQNALLPKKQSLLRRGFPVITILTVTKRTGWFDAAAKSLREQTLQDFKWVIVYEPNVRPQDDSLSIKWVPAPKKTKHSNLNASNNEGLRHVDTEYVVFYQDFIDLEPTALIQLLVDAQETEGFITTATINPDGKHDARYTGVNSIREVQPQEWEANVAIAPMQALYDLGGFDEDYDNGWSWDNVNVAERAELLGYRFYIDERIKPQLKFHPKEPDLDRTLELNYMRHEMNMRKIRIGQAPLKLPYL